jgi:penicillin-binding protein 2
MGVDMIHDWVLKFGAGPPTGIDLPNEIRGIIPDREWKKRVNPRDPVWKDFDTVLASIGQGSVAITPMQLLRAVSGVMMDGQYYTPHIYKESRNPLTQEVSYFHDKKEAVLKLSPETVDIVSYGAWGVVNEGGTAGGQFPRELNVGGKTGTAQVIAKEKVRTKEHRDHAWFISFAPLHTSEKPELAVVVLTENGGFGGRASAPKSKMIFGEYYTKKLGRPVLPELMAKGDGNAGLKPDQSATTETTAATPTPDRTRAPVRQ